jgi:hypothetical protein
MGLRVISTKAHGIADYLSAPALLALPGLLELEGPPKLAMQAVGATVLATAPFTDYEVGVKRVVPMRVHLALDLASGLLMAASPAAGGRRRWLAPVLAGAAEVAVALTTKQAPPKRRWLPWRRS